MKRGSKQGYECNSHLSMSGAGGQRLRSHLDLKGLQRQARALARQGQGLQGKRPPSRLAESGLKQAGAEAGPNHLLLVPRKGLRQVPRPIKDPSRAELSHKSRAIVDVICFYLKWCFLSLIHLYSNLIIFCHMCLPLVLIFT